MADVVSATIVALQQAGLKVWDDFVNIIPGLIAAIIVFLIGYIVAEVIRKVLQKAMEKALIDKWVDDRKLGEAIGKVKVSRLTAQLVKWYVVILFLAQALILINLKVLSDFASMLVMYVPKVAAAIVIIVLGLLLARYIGNKIIATKHRFKKQVQIIIEVVIAYVALVIGLKTLGLSVEILEELLKIAFTAFAIVAAIGFGIVFVSAYKKEIVDFARSLRK